MQSDTQRTRERTLPFPKRFKKELNFLYLFREVFSEPVCRNMHPLFRVSFQRLLRDRR